ncbi:MAG: hypothetical protein EBZ74_11660 [Planctomycetia bacterium]|nr:hypothetical protein [Planctomycetia bacterium]
MTSIYGTDPSLDYQFIYPSEVLGKKKQCINYTENSLMWYLESFHPKFAYIVKIAQLDKLLDYENSFFTLFLPPETTLEEDKIFNIDIHDAKRLVKYHLMTGIIPRDLLFTSLYQELNTTIKGEKIIAIQQGPGTILFNHKSYLLQERHHHITPMNGIIHYISEPLYHF